MLDHLTATGLVARTRSESDKRVVMVSLTAIANDAPPGIPAAALNCRS